MSDHDEELVERVAKALAEAEGYEVPQTGHYALAAAALRVTAPEREPCRPCPACIDRIRRAALDALAPELHQPWGRPDLHKKFPDIEPRLLDLLAHLEDEYGQAGVIRTIGKLWAEAPELRHDPPPGCEWVALPTEVINVVATVDACRATVARRPKPEPRTDRVPWGSHLRGRFVPREPTPITSVWCGPDGIERYGGDGWERSVCSGPVGVPCDGKVEVLVKDEGDGA